MSENDYNLDDVCDISSVSELMKIGVSDIKIHDKKLLLLNYASKSIGMVASLPKFKQILTQGDMLKKQFMEVLKLPAFRKDVVELLTIYLNRKANLPNYVVIMGTDFQLSVKYSKGSLIQIHVGDTYNITMY